MQRNMSYRAGPRTSNVRTEFRSASSESFFAGLIDVSTLLFSNKANKLKQVVSE
jgi:hypothetical protein